MGSAVFHGFQVLCVVRDHAKAAGLTKTDLAVLQALVLRAPHKDDPERGSQAGVAFPSVARLAEDTLLSLRAVRVALRALETRGLIRTTHVHGGRSSYDVRGVSKAITTAADAGVRELDTPAGNAPPPRHPLPGTPAPRAAKENHRRDPVEETSLRSGRAPVGAPAREARSQGDDGGSDSQPKPKPKKSSKPAKKRKRSRRKPERPLPDEWKPNATHAELATKLGVDLATEVAQFRDHAATNDRRARDWDAAFRNWLRNAKKFSDDRARRAGRGAPQNAPGRDLKLDATPPVAKGELTREQKQAVAAAHDITGSVLGLLQLRGEAIAGERPKSYDDFQARRAELCAQIRGPRGETT